MLKVGVVEDRSEIRNSLVKNINRTEGMICISSYANAEDALNGLPLDQPDLVLMDIGLPKMNGVECMIRLSLLDTSMDFIMFTIFDDDDNVFDALKAGAIGYILKSERILKIIEAIREYEAGGAPMSHNIARKVLASFNKKSNKGSLESLTKQQVIVLEQLAEGLLNKEIADRLGISERTVKQHNNAIYKKLQVFNRTEAVRKYLDEKG